MRRRRTAVPSQGTLATKTIIVVIVMVATAGCRHSDDDDTDETIAALGEYCDNPVNAAEVRGIVTTRPAGSPTVAIRCAEGLTCIAANPRERLCMVVRTVSRGEVCSDLEQADLADTRVCERGLRCVKNDPHNDPQQRDDRTCAVILNAGPCADSRTSRCSLERHCDGDTKMCVGPSGDGATCEKHEDCIPDRFFCPLRNSIDHDPARCERRRPPGADCLNDLWCEIGNVCAQLKCRPSG